MAYKVKYRLDYCNKEKLNARLDFEIKDYSSTIIHDIVGTQNAFSYKVRNEKPDRSGYFRTLEADINIFEDENFNIDNLLTSDETAIRVKFYIEGQIEFVGFIIPDFFEVSIDKPRVISMVASDRIGTLKNQTLPRQTGVQSFRYMLEQSLLKTGLDLPLNSTINFNPIGQSGDFLTNTGGLMERLSSDKGASISCYDIIKSILIVSNSFLMQSGGEWHILNKLEYESRPKTKDIEQINLGGRRLINPPSSQVGVMAEFAGGKTYPINYNFEQYSGGKFTGWSSVDGWYGLGGVPVIFNVFQNNRELEGYSGNSPILGDSNANISDLVNSNPVPSFSDPYSFPAFLKSDEVSVISDSDNEVLISVELNLKGKNLTRQYFSVGASKVGEVDLTLSESEGFVKQGGGTPGLRFLGGLIGDEEFDANSAVSKTFSYSGILKDENSDLRGWKIYIVLWGAGDAPTFIDSASFKFISAQKEIPKGNIFKIRQGVNFTKESEIDTTIFGDYINKGVNGYFYDYQKDEKNSIFYKIGTKWEHLVLRWRSFSNPNPDTLLLHSVRQRAIMFSSPHNIITAVIKGKFLPLDIYSVCGVKYVLVEANYNFYRNETELRIEEIKYDNSVLKTDYIYSYFGGEDTTSISGVSNVSSSGGGSGGGGAPCLIKIDDDGNYYVEENFYSLKDVSAFGKDELGGGGGDGVALTSWIDQITTLTDFNQSTNFINIQQVEAKGYATNTRVDGINSRLTSVEGGSVMTVTTSGSGNAITSISKSGTVITATKGDTFSKVGHSHLISDITNLQTELNSKASNTVVNGISGRLTTVESNYTTQSDIDTAIDGIEIGGRNLIIGSYNDWRGRTVGQFGSVLGYITIQDDWRGKTVTHSFEVKDIPEGESVQIRIDFHTTEASYITYGHGLSVVSSGKSKITYEVPSLESGYIFIRARIMAVGYTATYNVLFRGEKLEFGNKPTDWSPAPEDQVSDWNQSNVNAFDFIKNKPTKLSQFSNVETDFTSKTYVTTELNKKVDKVTGKSLISDSEISRLSTVVNQTATSIGLGNVTNESKETMFNNPTFTGTTKVTILQLNTNWKFVKVGNNIELQYNGVTKQEMTSEGHIISHGDVTALLDN